jgi:ubiquinone/menaquinone biosynthesis C-methylase UbiE
MSMWALGDYHAFAKETVWELGPRLVRACAIAPGQRVLDVAAGSGNVALRAAGAGASVVALDSTPENFEAGQAEADALGLDVEWVEGDAQALPFSDGEFDAVLSSLGVMFAPDHERAAAEMLRVCRPGGSIGVISFTPDGLGGQFFALFARHAPAPAESPPPVLWGDEDHVRELFSAAARLEMQRGVYTERAAGGPSAYVEFFQQTFGPLVGLRAALAEHPERLRALDADFLSFAERANSGPPDGAAEYPYEYLQVVARR